jgi:SAM-dependent methyltransferase
MTVVPADDPYYRRDLARIHHEGFAFHAENCAPGVLALLEPVRRRAGLVVEIGCGSGLLTRRLLEAGHRVIATDASPAMLELAREVLGDEADIRRLTLPGDPIPDADAVVGVGHALNYLPDLDSIERSLGSIARALRPDGVLAIDLCDLTYIEARRDGSSRGWAEDDWALVTRFETPSPDRLIRQMATFVRQEDGTWRRDDERHENVLVDTARVPEILTAEGVDATIARSFGNEEFPDGLVAVIGRRTTGR